MDKEQEAAVATLGSEGSSADVRLGGAGSGDSACRTDTTVPVLGGGKGARRGAHRRCYGRNNKEMCEEAAASSETAVTDGGDGRGGAADEGLVKRRLDMALGWRWPGRCTAVRLGEALPTVAPSDGSDGIGRRQSRLRDDDSERQGEGRCCGGFDSAAPPAARERSRSWGGGSGAL
jgi:hypothetical protein